MVEQIVKKHWKVLRSKPNVIGYSQELKPRIKDGQIIEGTSVFRVYVKYKPKDPKELNLNDLIPRTLALAEKTVETDIVELGEIKALGQVDKTVKFRPVKLGVSVGNWSITAGSLGMLYKNASGDLFAGSNAHVLADDPSHTPQQVTEKRVLQPGAYHGGRTEDNIVGEYFWHERIVPVGESGCPIGNGFSSTVNKILKVLGRRGRLTYTAISENKIDFAVYLPSVEHLLTVADDSLTNEKFIGHLFAGSELSGIICKVKYIEEVGYTPLIEPIEVQDGDRVKGCSFWCNFATQVLDASAAVTVGYGTFEALFTDVIIVANDGTIRGGWSGSGWRKL